MDSENKFWILNINTKYQFKQWNPSSEFTPFAPETYGF